MICFFFIYLFCSYRDLSLIKFSVWQLSTRPQCVTTPKSLSKRLSEMGCTNSMTLNTAVMYYFYKMDSLTVFNIQLESLHLCPFAKAIKFWLHLGLTFWISTGLMRYKSSAYWLGFFIVFMQGFECRPINWRMCP